MERTVKVAVGSLFRNSAQSLGYFRALFEHQIGAGRDFELLFSFVEGDSHDDTWERLNAWAAADSRVRVGKMDVEPVTSFEDRVRKWATLGNAVIEGLDGRDYDWFLWCESDLCIPPDLVLQLLAAGKDVVAPGIFLGGMFYDTWGFRGLDGQRYQNVAPHHGAYHPFALRPVASAGSVVLFNRAVIESGIRFRGVHEDGLLVGVCNDARALGFEVWHDSRVAVIHPTTLWMAQQYTLGRIAVDLPDGDPAESLWRSAINAALRVEHPIVGTPDLELNHAVFDGLRSVLSSEVPERSFDLHSRLLSESPKRYELVITDLASKATPCPSSTTH